MKLTPVNRVKQILHHEKSKFQVSVKVLEPVSSQASELTLSLTEQKDVLLFESETYGNVLVLDNVIQCTERDEFSYSISLTSHLS